MKALCRLTPAALALLVGAFASPLAAQTWLPCLWVEPFWSSSPGFDVLETFPEGRSPREYHTDLELGWGIGVGTEVGILDERVSLQLEVDWLPSAHLLRRTGLPLKEDRSGGIVWATLSAALHLGAICRTICATPLVGAGIAKFSFEYLDGCADICMRFFEPQTVPVIRAGVDFSVPRVSESLRLGLSGYASSVETARKSIEEDRVYAFEIGIAWSPNAR